MGKLYTLDRKLLTGTPEIRIGETVYPIDDRQKTVKKVIKMTTDEKNAMDNIDEVLKLAFGAKAAKEIDELNMPFAAYQQLFELVVAAMTGEDPEEVSARFQEAKTAEEQQQPHLV